MTTEVDPTHNERWQLVLWTLRIAVVLQCLGNWRWLTQIEETPLLHWLASPRDIGGLAWNEPMALTVQSGVGWSLLLAAALVLWRPQVLVLLPLAGLQVLIATAMWQLADGYALQADWVPLPLLMLFPFATQLMRIAAPAGLLLLVSRWLTPAKTMQLLRWSVAIVFFAHGIEAWQQNPKFLDLIINANQRLFGVNVAQTTAQWSLTVIGAIDMALAIVCVSFRWLGVLGWLTFWGGVTAIARGLANGWDVSWHEVLARSSHCGIPLSVAIWWHLLRWETGSTTTAKDHSPLGT